jgi:hypothetical protein
MWRRRFQDEQSIWSCADSPRWLKEFERLGPEKVRQCLVPFARQGERAAIPIGKVNDVTKGYVTDWLAWNDSRKVDWGKWGFWLGVAVAVFGLVGWVITNWSFFRDLAVSVAG